MSEITKVYGVYWNEFLIDDKVFLTEEKAHKYAIDSVKEYMARHESNGITVQYNDLIRIVDEYGECHEEINIVEISVE